MLWLLVTILSYLILAGVFLTDKYFLSGRVLEPGSYAFYVGILGIVIIFIAPFLGVSVPEPSKIILALLAGAAFIYANFWFYKALKLFETSRVVPAVGGLVPLFTLAIIYLLSFLSQEREIFTIKETMSFFLLVSGSVLITLEKEKINWMGLKISALAAFLFSLSFVLSKYVFMSLSFWNGFFWIKIGGVLMAVVFFISKPTIRESFSGQTISLKKRTIAFFLSIRVASAGANILQNWAVALASLSYVAIINALQGVQYVFLLAFTALFSLIYPQWTKNAGLKEKISKKIIFQKIIAILLIGAGLIILAFKL